MDLAVLDAALPGARGLSLALEFSQKPAHAGVVLLADKNGPVSVAAAAAAGLLDLIEADLPAAALATRFDVALQRVRSQRRREAARRRERRQARRLARRCDDLEARCIEVEAARLAISEQVETLCGDLVNAYQELADRLDAAESLDPHADAANHPDRPDRPADLETSLRGELGLEPVIRTTLEHLVAVSGGTNAAIFLPASMNEYSLGGYVHPTATPESASMLLEHLADVVAPKLAEAVGPIHLTDNDQLAAWFDDDAAWLDDSELLGVPCMLESDDDSEAETLAVVLLFRDRDQPFGAEVLEACERLGPVLAESLHRVIRVHHRLGFSSEDFGDGALES